MRVRHLFGEHSTSVIHLGPLALPCLPAHPPPLRLSVLPPYLQDCWRWWRSAPQLCTVFPLLLFRARRRTGRRHPAAWVSNTAGRSFSLAGEHVCVRCDFLLLCLMADSLDFHCSL